MKEYSYSDLSEGTQYRWEAREADVVSALGSGKERFPSQRRGEGWVYFYSNWDRKTLLDVCGLRVRR